MTRQDARDTPSGWLFTETHLLGGLGALCRSLDWWAAHFLVSRPRHSSSVYLRPTFHLFKPHGGAPQVQEHKTHLRNDE